MDLAQLAAKMGAAAVAVDHCIDRSLERAAILLETSAKEAIGTYEFGWPALAPATVARKGADTPLLETGRLQGSIEHQVGHHEAWVGTNDPNAAFQEFGTSRGIPPRPFMGGAVEHEGDKVVGVLLEEVRKVL